MSESTGIRSMNMADSGPVPWPDPNKDEKMNMCKNPTLKPLNKAEESKGEVVIPPIRVKSSALAHSVSVPSILRRNNSLLSSNLSLNASCSSDASTDSFHSRASTGRIGRTSSKTSRKKQVAAKQRKDVVSNGISESVNEGVKLKTRCAWAAVCNDPSYVVFHDEEWGVPTHDDKKLFEFLVLSGTLAELTWPSILSKRHIFREVFADFDPIIVAKMSEKKITATGSLASSLLSELKLRSIIENARQFMKVIDEFGSFDKYIWSFINQKPIVSGFRYPRQVPVKTPKADVISKDLVKRGFRGVGPTVVYSFMQVAGLTNDHLVSCFRFHDCTTEAEGKKDASKTYEFSMN